VVAVGGGDVPLLQTGVGFRAHPQQALLEAGSPALAACGPPQHWVACPAGAPSSSAWMASERCSSSGPQKVALSYRTV
jgi:hypothetical protein